MQFNVNFFYLCCVFLSLDSNTSFLIGQAFVQGFIKKIGQHDDRVCLEVGAKLFGRHTDGQCYLFETLVSSLCFC